MDLVWLVIPAAVGLLAVRIARIARKLRLAAGNVTETGRRGLRDARRWLRAHRDQLEGAKAATRTQLAAAKAMRRAGRSPPRTSRGLDAMVQDCLPERRL